ncbi:hypothetical protein F2Q69_00057856 [Brassica cretica]|uniref:Cysteine-rich transmembrane CYSTM domain-containing protein n=1 Tax=Brassica cretica TaxID=69181 RepID=A0A8S9MRR3_BRACR|nr:hypothetical protein F2Q69_00057856 [Brassica cretica]
MSDPKYAYPYPAPGNYPHGPPPPVGVPPQYYAPPPPPPRKKPGFLEGLTKTCGYVLLLPCG